MATQSDSQPTSIRVITIRNRVSWIRPKCKCLLRRRPSLPHQMGFFKMLTNSVNSLVDKWQHPHAFWIFTKGKKLMVMHSITNVTTNKVATSDDFKDSDNKDNEQDNKDSNTMAMFSGQPVDHVVSPGFLNVKRKTF